MKLSTINQIVESILAMEYFTGTHSENEFQEFRTGVVGGKE